MIHVGWREWVRLPELGIPAIKAKMDSGARTSAIHADRIETFTADERTMVRFTVTAIRARGRRSERKFECVAPAIDRRWVTDSGGHREFRWIIQTPLQIGTVTWTVEISLVNRATLRFPMLVGRAALQGRCLIDPSHSYLTGKELKKGLVTKK